MDPKWMMTCSKSAKNITLKSTDWFLYEATLEFNGFKMIQTNLFLILVPVK